MLKSIYPSCMLVLRQRFSRTDLKIAIVAFTVRHGPSARESSRSTLIITVQVREKNTWGRRHGVQVQKPKHANVDKNSFMLQTNPLN